MPNVCRTFAPATETVMRTPFCAAVAGQLQGYSGKMARQYLRKTVVRDAETDGHTERNRWDTGNGTQDRAQKKGTCDCSKVPFPVAGVGHDPTTSGL